MKPKVDWPELDSATETLLEAEKQAPAAPSEAKRRVLEAVRQSVGQIDVPEAAQASPGAGTSAAGLGTSLLKGTAIFLLGSALGGALLASWQAPEVERIYLELPQEQKAVAASRYKETIYRYSEVPEEIDRISPSKQAQKTPGTVPKPQEPAPDTLAEERRLLTQARSALARKRPAAALKALARHEKNYPKGQLREERWALQVQVLMSLGKDQAAREKAREFIWYYPKSLFRPVVESALKP